MIVAASVAAAATGHGHDVLDQLLPDKRSCTLLAADSNSFVTCRVRPGAHARTSLPSCRCAVALFVPAPLHRWSRPAAARLLLDILAPLPSCQALGVFVFFWRGQGILIFGCGSTNESKCYLTERDFARGGAEGIQHHLQARVSHHQHYRHAYTCDQQHRASKKTQQAGQEPEQSSSKSVCGGHRRSTKMFFSCFTAKTDEATEVDKGKIKAQATANRKTPARPTPVKRAPGPTPCRSPPSPVRRRSPSPKHYRQRSPSPPSPCRSVGSCGGGCFAGDGLVAVGEAGEQTRRVDELRVGDKVFAPNLQREVDVVATTRAFETKVCIVNGLRISRKHPVKSSPGSAWVAPQDISETMELLEPLVVHNFVLSAGGAMQVNGMSVVTLGPSEAMRELGELFHPYYGTTRVLNDLKAMPTWPCCECVAYTARPEARCSGRVPALGESAMCRGTPVAVDDDRLSIATPCVG